MENNNESNDFVPNIFIITEKYLKKYEFRFNEIALDIEYRLKDGKEFKSVNENSLYIELQKAGIKISIANLLALLRSDYVKKFNPIKEYFLSLPPWDNKPHIQNLCTYLPAADSKQFEYHFIKWFVRCVKCVFNDDYFNKQAFVIVQKQQSSGKTTFCRFICPPALKSYIAEDISNDKDARILLAKNILINLDELAVLSRQEINQLKAYFTKTVINERLPYDRKNSILSRICSFIGSTNEGTFLNDESGSVRWLCFEIIGQINFAYSKDIDINKVWAQAYALSKTDFDCELSPKDIQENEKRNSKYKKLSAEFEIVSKYFKIPENTDNAQFMTSSDVLHYLSIKYPKLNHINIGKAMNGLGFERIKDRERQIYGYMVLSLPLFPMI
ncbi:VapE domain-containing protein [Flavobacterium sp. KACC 22761]|uniref:VapE domain-containing protein n=1 Tax=Flavobacterium sp. KACC 22761 TaxID=3092665 RepID=UPI002A765C91|nr:VapE domain-containing protein [Flavobacterium sp. KACC 22761]WPO78199.1 VapE family protein [Flavobacterium sp. KACC 22761]